MHPIACGLDILQGVKITGLGFLLPTLTVIENQLNALLEDNTFVKPLIDVLKAGISKRFGEIKNNTDAQLAAVVHPQFKLYWLDDETQKAQLVSTLKSRIDNKRRIKK